VSWVRRTERTRLGAAVALCCALAACGERIDVAAVPALSDADAAVDPVACAASGDDLALTDGECIGDWLAARLGQALCSCEDYAGSAGLGAGAFSGVDGVYTDDGPGGDVRIDGALNLGADASLLGRLAVAGAAGLSLGSGQTLRVAGALQVAGDLAASAATLELLDDAAVGGQLLAEALQVDGTLTMSDPAALQVSGTSSLGALLQGAVSVAPGCACDGVLPTLTEPAVEPGTPEELVVCGSQRRGPLESDGDVLISGAGLLQIDGDVGIGGRLSFAVPAPADPGAGSEATLFVVVSGNLRVDGGLEAMAADPRSRVHLLVAGDGTVQLDGGSRLTGSLYAPTAELVTSAPLEVFGAVLVRRAAVSAQLDLHFDASLGAALRSSCD
jgi:cytoskeletal protein CcmA (bactofilin family)